MMNENISFPRASARPFFSIAFAWLLIFGLSSLFAGELLFDIKENAGEWTLYCGDEPLGDLPVRGRREGRALWSQET